MQPLSKEARALYSKNSQSGLVDANKGLLFDRFFDGYDSHWSVPQGDDARVLDNLKGKSGNVSELAAAAARRVALSSSLGGSFGVFTTDWHFVTGMGNAHPVENGFTWHPVYGTPYLPGSSVKGLLRAWMESWAQDVEGEGQPTDLVRSWFGAGADGKGDAGKAGDLIFFDALPVECPTVSTDIMTPHMGKWYEQGGEKLTAESQPGDWHNPVPVTFLVASDARFVFSIAPRTPAAREQGLAEQAMEHLKNALAWLGAGAKTAAGYGHMTFDKDDTLLRFTSPEKRAQIERERAAQKQKENLAEAGIAVGEEVWDGAVVTDSNPGAGEVTISYGEEFAVGKFYSQLSKKDKDKLKKKKQVKVKATIDRQGNQLTILELTVE